MQVGQGFFFFPHEQSGILFSLNLGLAADFNHNILEPKLTQRSNICTMQQQLLQQQQQQYLTAILSRGLVVCRPITLGKSIL